MDHDNFPDPGADIVVYTRSGRTFRGTVMLPHTMVDKSSTLCLALDDGGVCVRNYEQDSELMWQYIRIADIEAWTWDCRP